ncbi:hypothetical protein JTB14_036887 [Gonioctena quinquepunctata]|nr:hypothetical protein JTB14_036887 [Gonioctena quinquepunctata]
MGMKVQFILLFCGLFVLLAISKAEEHVCICPRHFRPICASDGNTYSNECIFKCHMKKLGVENLEIVADGSCGIVTSDAIF